MLLFLLSACGQFILGVDATPWTHVVTDTLDGAQILDARSAEAYAAGHVPGAANVHWTEVTDFDEDGLWGPLPPAESAEILGARGISADAPVVVYGSGPGGYGDDGDLYWTLRYLGHPDVRVYNGGWAGWLAAGNTPSTTADGPDATTFAHREDPTVLASTEDVEDWSGPLLDVRTLDEWEDGHIPGASWMEWTEVFADEATLLPEEEVRALLDTVGISGDEAVITYCQGGIRAGHTFMVLEALRVPGVRNYVGSWARWSAEGGEVELP